MKVRSTAASPVKRPRAATSREQALRQLIAAAEGLVEQGERAFFEIPSGRLTTEAGSARPTMYAPAAHRLVDSLAAVCGTPFSMPSLKDPPT